LANSRIESAKETAKDNNHEIMRKMNVYTNPEFKEEQLKITSEQQSCVLELEELSKQISEGYTPHSQAFIRNTFIELVSNQEKTQE
jgi:hypothetical protein